MRKPISLRWRLLVPLIITAIITSALLYFTMRQVTKQAVQATQEALLEKAVTSILEQTRFTENNVEIDLPYNIFTMLGAISEDKVYYRVDLDGLFLTGYEDLRLKNLTVDNEYIFFSSTIFRGVKLRQATVQQLFLVNGKSRLIQITVAQTQLFQEAILRDMSRNAGVIGISFFGFALLVALLATRSFLRPINSLAGTVSRRGAHDLRPVKGPTPPELMPLVLSLNGFISRLTGTLRQTETFIAEAAHHIRTPLSLVKSESQLALRKSKSSENRKHLHNIIESVDMSIRSAGQLLDHALVLYRSEKIDEKRLDLAVVVQHVADNLQPAADLKDIIIKTEIINNGDIFVMADRVLLEVALRNMLDNAIKYSNPDQLIFVKIVLDQNFVRIIVLDNGRGIKGVKTKGIHKRFKRGSNVDDVIGSGLGLAIISEICIILGGSFILKNNKGVGACAILQLPVC